MGLLIPLYACLILPVITSVQGVFDEFETTTQCFHCIPEERASNPNCTSPEAPVQEVLLCEPNSLGCITMSISQPSKLEPLFYKNCFSKTDINCFLNATRFNITYAKCGEFSVEPDKYINYKSCMIQELKKLTPPDTKDVKDPDPGALEIKEKRRRRRREYTPQVPDNIEVVPQQPIELYEGVHVEIKYCLCTGNMCNLQRYFDKAKFKPISEVSKGTIARKFEVLYYFLSVIVSLLYSGINLL